MQGLVNHAFEAFLRDTYGVAQWRSIAVRAGLGFEHFEPLLVYPPEMTEQIVSAAAEQLGRSSDGLMEDLGTWLVSPRSGGRVRRLLRFGGTRFTDFLHSLEELPDRARLILAELDLPEITLLDIGGGVYRLLSDEPFHSAHQVLSGLLRAMADDYGALVLIEVAEAGISIQLLDAQFAESRSFDLAAGQW